MRVGTASDRKYPLLVRLLTVSPIKQHVARQQVGDRNYQAVVLGACRIRIPVIVDHSSLPPKRIQ